MPAKVAAFGIVTLLEKGALQQVHNKIDAVALVVPPYPLTEAVASKVVDEHLAVAEKEPAVRGRGA